MLTSFPTRHSAALSSSHQSLYVARSRVVSTHMSIAVTTTADTAAAAADAAAAALIGSFFRLRPRILITALHMFFSPERVGRGLFARMESAERTLQLNCALLSPLVEPSAHHQYLSTPPHAPHNTLNLRRRSVRRFPLLVPPQRHPRNMSSARALQCHGTRVQMNVPSSRRHATLCLRKEQSR